MQTPKTIRTNRQLARAGRLFMATLAVLAIGGTAYADKPEKENGKGKNKQEQEYKQDKQDKRAQKEGKDDRYDRDDKNDRKYKGDKSAERQQRDGDYRPVIDFGFRNDDSRLVREYYGSQAAKGNCPPGLAKKGNGCLPPGQAKKWQRGQRLDSDARYYDIPNELRLRLPTPPRDHRYVQYGTDVLLIQAGTALVVDAITGIF